MNSAGLMYDYATKNNDKNSSHHWGAQPATCTACV